MCFILGHGLLVLGGTRLRLGTESAGQFYQRFACLGRGTKKHVFYYGEMLLRNVGIGHLGRRVDNGKVHATEHTLIEKHSMHGLTNVVVATEGERQITDTA